MLIYESIASYTIENSVDMSVYYFGAVRIIYFCYLLRGEYLRCRVISAEMPRGAALRWIERVGCGHVRLGGLCLWSEPVSKYYT